MKDQKYFYNYIRQEYKKKKDVTEVPEFMKVYYEIEYASNYEINKFYYAVCNYIFLGISPRKDVKDSTNWKDIEPYAIAERQKVLKENGKI